MQGKLHLLGKTLAKVQMKSDSAFQKKLQLKKSFPEKALDFDLIPEDIL